MSRIDYIQLRLTDNGTRQSGVLFLKRDEIEYIVDNNPELTGGRRGTQVRSKGQNWFVLETPTQVIDTINASRFGRQTVREQA